MRDEAVTVPSDAAFRAAVLERLSSDHGGRRDLCSVRRAMAAVLRGVVVPIWQSALERGAGHKRVAYLSMEFLIGRLAGDTLLSLGLRDAAKAVCLELGLTLDDVLEVEPDAALGNGGLGRLAACFLDSMATVGCPAVGYGLRYEHGLFRQGIEDDKQTETPEDWLSRGYPWELRSARSYGIGFFGTVTDGVWKPSETIWAQGYDVPVPGWQGSFAGTLRLWAAEAVQSFDLGRFNGGDHVGASETEASARALCRVLYPDDGTEAGQTLRLKQEYFLSAASLADLLADHRAAGLPMETLPDHVAIQLNDTHPAIAGPELMRVLIDEEGLEFDAALKLARGVLNYTNHTLLPEALESWPEMLLGWLLPRHLEIIRMLAGAMPGAGILGGSEVRMGNLAFAMAGRVNGVSALHTELMKETVFAGLHRQHPERIVNQTNGVTPRRWIAGCNPGLAGAVTAAIGEGWLTDLERLGELEPLQPGVVEAMAEVKRANKVQLAAWLGATQGVQVDPGAMFDVQIKRIHEYKRQHLNILETIALWQEMRDAPQAGWVPRVKIFAGKAAPGYHFAKEIIHLIGKVARMVNADPVTGDLLKVVFLPNYNVSLAERLIPAADLSEQISTAGKEASGTGNMKFAMNGALTIGTLDGANVEIRERVGAENFLLFGMTAEEVSSRRAIPDHAATAIEAEPRLARALEALRDGTFIPDWPDLFAGIADNVSGPDHFLVASDFADYWRAQREADRWFADADGWAEKAALNVARSGWFSSDRTIRGYMADIWGISPVSA
ncbi:glycogen/starch/alpha-glucan phosphorylase [Aestuariibius insulae]|uniref:glycogen/starch/alpha-glucan phosphorylase n=1 Tax=Aestuariibius insulae TaxID=2058287 RepID=UPI00398E861B